MEVKEIKNGKMVIPNVNTEIFVNMVYAVFTVVYFMSLNIVYVNCSEAIFEIYTKISYLAHIIISILTIELAYKSDSGKIAVYGIEYIIIATYILLIDRVVSTFKFNMSAYIVLSSYIFSIYYTFKSMIIDTIERKRILDSLSDVKDIVKEEKPSKKLAKKRKM